ncbi:MAG: DNA recombination protein RmuC [Chitinophagaceae bacterium]|nr:DNA recombination protein RmuC [Chitinophagaceae bacterium]
MGLVAYILISFFIGALVVFTVYHSLLSKLRYQYAQAKKAEDALPQIEQEKWQLIAEQKAQLATVVALKEKILLLQEDKQMLEQNLKQYLKELTKDNFIQQGNLLAERQFEKLSDLLNPLKENIKNFETKVATAQSAAQISNVQLLEQIKQLTSLNKEVTQKTSELTNALTGSNKLQGAWGELILERVLERSGLVKGKEYDTQFATTNQGGDSIRPDAVVYLPDQKNIIIDSKVSLTAYERYANTQDETIRASALSAHLVSLKSHIQLLGAKNYHTALGLNSPDFMLMFLPIESSFALSLQHDTTMFEYAWERKIVLVSPSTLLATLRTIAAVWKNEYQARYAIEIAQKAGNLFDKFVAFTEDLELVGKSIAKADEAYEKALNKLSTGKGNLVGRAQQLKNLGVDAQKKLSDKLLNSGTEA